MAANPSDLFDAVQYVWPSSAGPEAAVRRTAAEFLLKQPGNKARCVLVASHVSATVGKVSSLGIDKGFEQVLSEDPCFAVDKSQANAVVLLQAAQLLSQASWRQDEQQAQQQQQQVQTSSRHQPGASAGAGASSSSGAGLYIRATPKLLQGLEAVWPFEGPKATAETKVKHRAVMQLVSTPQHSMLRSTLTSAVKADLGVSSIWDLGCTSTFSQLLKSAPGIFLVGAAQAECDVTVSLNVQGCLSTFVRQLYHTKPTSGQQHAAQIQQQQQQQRVLIVPRAAPGLHQQQQQQRAPQQGSPVPDLHYQAQPPPPQQAAYVRGDAGVSSSTAAANTVSAAALLQYVRSRSWHSTLPIDTVRRALAERLVLKANPAAATAEGQQPASTEAKRYAMLSAMAGESAVCPSVLVEANCIRGAFSITGCGLPLCALPARQPRHTVPCCCIPCFFEHMCCGHAAPLFATVRARAPVPMVLLRIVLALPLYVCACRLHHCPGPGNPWC